MFIVSMKMNRKKILAAAIGVVLVLIGLVACAAIRGNENSMPTSATTAKVEKTADIVSFLEGYGWEVSAEPCEIEEVAIPTEFNEVYENYNTIQKKQGYDLTAFQGMSVKRYAFDVLNYPDQPENIRANVLVYDNQIIGGDICSVAIDGFMHGFEAE